MNFLPPNILDYSQAHTSPESALLHRLNRNTYANILHPRMLSGHVQGRFLALISKLVRPRRILEIGTYTGYSALCLAEGLTDDGQLITIDKNEELEAFTRSYWQESTFADRIELRIGNAPDIIPTLQETFDLVFIDADKENYSLYYDLIFDKVRPAGIIIADNVLWSGKVVETNHKPDEETQALLDFNKKVQEDFRTENILLPMRDGLMMVYKL